MAMKRHLLSFSKGINLKLLKIAYDPATPELLQINIWVESKFKR
jgi:hypothetical protein